MKHARHILYLLIAAALATGCWGWVEYFDVTADKIKVPEGISDVILQEGTTLTIDLKALKALYPGYHNQEPATMTLSLIN